MVNASNTTKYSMAFTTGSLFLSESIIIAKEYVGNSDWATVRSHVIGENLLKCRTESSSKKITGEIIKRLKFLSEDELKFIVEASTDEQAWMLWIGICKCYGFINDFADEVIREKYLTLYSDVSMSDYDNFFNKKADWHDELDKLSVSSRSKLRQVVFKMLRQVGLLNKENQIQPVLLTGTFVRSAIKKSREYLSVFPISDSQIKDYVL